MYNFLSNLLEDKKGGEVFACFGIYHIIYIVVFLTALFGLVYFLRNKSQEMRKRVINIVITVAFCTYMADFFLMPFAYGEIDVDKLPFHACTSMCIMCFWSRHNKFLGKFKLQFTLIGLISNIIYVVYPMGVASYEIHPLSYRAVQTLGFHAVMVVYAILALVYDDLKFEWKKCYRELALLGIMAVWAIIGNTCYSGTKGDYSHDFNWFFVDSDPFGLLPESISPYIMPFVTVTAFFGMNMIIYLVYFGIKKLNKKK